MKPPSPIVLAVWISSASLGLAQQAGSLDLTFNPGLGADGTVFCMALQTNGQVVIGGNFQNFNGQPNHYVARLNLDGSLDTTFNVGQGPSGSVQCVAIQTDGKIVIGGSFNGVDGVGRFGVARLRNDGSLDTSFIPPTTETIADALAVQSDGRVLVGGQGLPNFVERLNADGSFDTNFNVGIGANSSVLALGVQPNGQILVGGAFSSFNGTNLLSLARLNADGSLDSNFNPALSMGGGDQWVKCLALMPNGQIVVGGDFQTVNGYTHQGVARLNASGSIDTTFNTPLSSTHVTVSSAVVQSDGKCLLFETTPATFVSSLLRVNPTGSTDVTFSTGNFSPFAAGNVMALQSDGKLLVAGGFTSFNGTNINNIVRLNGDSSTPVQPQLLSPSLYMGMTVSGVVGTTNRIEATFSLNTNALWTPLFNVVLQTNAQFIVDPTQASFPSRFYRAVQIP